MNEILKLLLPQVVSIAKEAGNIIMDVYQNGFEIETKADDSPVTSADLAANAYIINALQKLFPLYPILSEEDVAVSFEERLKRETYWLIDPLDGTKEFIKRSNKFTVNIALIHQNKAILGVVYAPALGVNYYACKDHGAFKELPNQEVQVIKARSIPQKPAFVGSFSHKGDLKMFLDNVKTDLGDYNFTSMGSSLKMCLVAEGEADLYPRLWLTSEWDTAAAHCIVDEAGGQLVKTNMSPLLYNTKDSLLNPFFFVIGNNDINWARYLPK